MPASFQFVMRSGPTPGVTFALEGDQLIIGRDASNAVAINDAEVSRKHARLTFQGGKYVIEDLGSTNGTFVNGQRVSNSTVLKPGDIVSLGEQIVLMYEGLAVDSGATMIGRKAARPAVATVSAPAPMPATPMAAPVAAAPGRRNLPLIIGAGVVGLICLCAVVAIAVDQLYLWCTFPFNIVPSIMGMSCP
ncbi:MAG TPA: FHA domain-containing protein [Anaerolineales bacterium]